VRSRSSKTPNRFGLIDRDLRQAARHLSKNSVSAEPLLQIVPDFTNGPALDSPKADVLRIRRQRLQSEPGAIYCLPTGVFEVWMHLDMNPDANPVPAVLEHLRLER
jgi:hypothetical protein